VRSKILQVRKSRTQNPESRIQSRGWHFSPKILKSRIQNPESRIQTLEIFTSPEIQNPESRIQNPEWHFPHDRFDLGRSPEKQASSSELKRGPLRGQIQNPKAQDGLHELPLKSSIPKSLNRLLRIPVGPAGVLKSRIQNPKTKRASRDAGKKGQVPKSRIQNPERHRLPISETRQNPKS
jgi:hypothetical protein